MVVEVAHSWEEEGVGQGEERSQAWDRPESSEEELGVDGLG